MTASSPTTPTAPAAPVAANAAPLSGVRVLDLTRLLPGPMCTLHLADLGADVIKIEDTGAGDYAAPALRGLVQRNKRALRIDLKRPEGVAVLLALVRTADVLVEGFRPGVMDRLGVGYATLSALNPKLVFCSITGYGRTAPTATNPATT
jgi:alpha-methylacyl-CoA racemase